MSKCKGCKWNYNGTCMNKCFEKPQGDLISRKALKEDFKSRLAVCNEWIEKAKDKETKIRASAVKAFIGEVIMAIDNAPAVTDRTEEVLSLQSTIAKLVDGIAENARPKGEWKHIIEEDNDVECPFCGFQEDGVYNNFCPKCGADMRGAE